MNADAPNRVWAVDFQFDVTTDSPAQLHSGAVTEANHPRQGIQSVELAMTIIEAIERGLGPMSLTQIAKASGMGSSKVHRYLVSLSRIGLIAQSKHSGLYDLGPAMRRVGGEALRRMDEVGLVSEHLPELRDRTSHAVNLAVWGDHGPVLVRWAYGSYALPITVRVGATMPLLTSSVGRVYLAYLPESLTLPVLESQLAADPKGIPSADELTALREEVRRRGVAETSGGVVPGVMSLAAPVFPAGETIPLVIALALPAALADTATMTAIEAELLHTIEVISNDLGGTAADLIRPSSRGAADGGPRALREAASQPSPGGRNGIHRGPGS